MTMFVGEKLFGGEIFPQLFFPIERGNLSFPFPTPRLVGLTTLSTRNLIKYLAQLNRKIRKKFATAKCGGGWNGKEHKSQDEIV
jgi:hypothetical protein